MSVLNLWGAIACLLAASGGVWVEVNMALAVGNFILFLKGSKL